jgi:alpha-1,6-mannosyltransferase
VIVTSRFSAEEFDRIGAVNVRQVPLGVDLDEFRPAAVPPTGDGSVRLVILSRLSREKRPERAIDALSLLRADGIDAELTIVGDGPLRARLEARAAGLPVQFRGHMSGRQAVAALVAGADIALSPSPADTFGLATLEALACGTPVVVTADGAASELIGGAGSGVVCDGTPRGLAEGVRSLLAMPVATRRAAARAAAERFRGRRRWPASSPAMRQRRRPRFGSGGTCAS